MCMGVNDIWRLKCLGLFLSVLIWEMWLEGVSAEVRQRSPNLRRWRLQRSASAFLRHLVMRVRDSRSYLQHVFCYQSSSGRHSFSPCTFLSPSAAFVNVLDYFSSHPAFMSLTTPFSFLQSFLWLHVWPVMAQGRQTVFPTQSAA